MTKKLAIVLLLAGSFIFAGPKNGPKIADDLDLTSSTLVNVNITYSKPPSLLDSLNLLGLVKSVLTLLGNILNRPECL